MWMERVEALLAVKTGMLPRLAAHCHSRVPTGCPRMAHTTQSRQYFVPASTNLEAVALPQIRMGKRGSFTIANPRSAVSFDHLVGQREQLIRLVEPKRLVAALERVRGHALRVLR